MEVFAGPEIPELSEELAAFFGCIGLAEPFAEEDLAAGLVDAFWSSSELEPVQGTRIRYMHQPL